MSKKTILVLLGFAFLFNFHLVYAGVVINEVMYNPTDGSDYEWIEILNDSNEQINLDGWRFFNSESSSAPLRTSGSFVLESHSYALITGNNSLVSFSGQIFTSSQFSLPNDSSRYGTYKGIYSDSSKTIGSSVTYNTELGANGNGKSLQKISGSWAEATPTLGVANENIPVIEPVVSSGGGSSSSSATDSKPKTAEIPKIKTKILAKTLAFVGTPIEFSASTTGHSSELLNYGQYFWNFGDGDSKETKASDTTKFSHTFFYEGEYVITLEYYQNYYSENPEASSEIIIKVIPANVSISSVGDEKDFFVEISNGTDYDADISKWILSSGTKSFTFPKNTILGSKKKMILSPKITGFSFSDKDTLKLSNPQWETIFDYSTSVRSVKVSTKNSTPVKVFVAEKNIETEMPNNNLEATAIKNDSSEENNLMYGIGLFAFLGISASAAYFIRSRSKKDLSPTGSDFVIE